MSGSPRREGLFTATSSGLVADDGHLKISFDASTGGICRVENVATGQILMDIQDPVPWRLRRQGAEWSVFPSQLPPWFYGSEIIPGSFTFEITADGGSATLEWTTSEPGVTIEVGARFEGGAGELHLRPRLLVEKTASPPDSLTYPILASPSLQVDGGPGDQFIAPSHSGWLVRRPLSVPAWRAPYPDGYAGCSMQFTAYIQEGVGGFYLATHDPHSTWKDFMFGKDEWSVCHYGWDLRDGTSAEYGYPVVLAPLTTGDWFEPAARYRKWAVEAPWSRTSIRSDGLPGSDRSARGWLQEEVGLAIWGAPASLDWSPWYSLYAEAAGTPLHLCPGWDWPARLPQSLGEEGWFPARFHEANLAAWEGHFVTPYMCDLFISRQAEGFDERWEPNLIYPYVIFPFTRFSEFDTEVVRTGHPGSDPLVTTDIPFYMCPGTEAQAALHAWRDAGLMRDYPMAGVCYDISSGNPRQISRCLRWEHGHPPGRGRHMIEAADRVNRRSKAAVQEATGKYLVQGVETIIENIIGSVDFYVARAGAGPLGYHEAWVPAHEEPPGTGRELLPLFEAVYHDIGPVRHDGWLTMDADHGDLFFWAAGRTVVQWGGLLSLHYSYGFAYNPPERIDGVEEMPEHVNWDGATVRFESLPELDPAKAAFVGELARARTKLATPYLSHGRMLRPIPIEPKLVTLSFAGSYSSAPTLILDGTWDVPAVVHGAWQAPGGGVGLLFLAIGSQSASIRVEADPAVLWDLDLAGSPLTVRTGNGLVSSTIVADDGRIALDLELDSRVVYLVEIGEGSLSHHAAVADD